MDTEEREGSCCILCCTVIFLGVLVGFQIQYIYILRIVLLFICGFILVICLTALASGLREQCLYWQLRYEIYQLDRYLERESRRSNVSIVPVEPPPIETVIVIQNPNHISLGYISKPEV
jgi:hypothetical protein